MEPKMRRRSLLLLMLILATFTLAVSMPAHAQEAPKLNVPYVPTPPEVVNRMLDMAKIKQGEKHYDLGSGDGRIVIEAAKRGAIGVGIDLNPERIEEARTNAKKAGVEDRVEFKNMDLFKADFSDADVVTLYLLPSVNRDLRPQLWRQLRVGTRVVSHAFDMGKEWPPEQTEKVDHRTIYYWTITENHKKAVEGSAGN